MAPPGCGTSDDVRRAVERLVRPGTQAGAGLRLSGTIVPATGHNLKLTLSGSSEYGTWTRELIGATCLDLRDAAVALMALAIDPKTVHGDVAHGGDDTARTPAASSGDAPTPNAVTTANSANVGNGSRSYDTATAHGAAPGRDMATTCDAATATETEPGASTRTRNGRSPNPAATSRARTRRTISESSGASGGRVGEAVARAHDHSLGLGPSGRSRNGPRAMRFSVAARAGIASGMLPEPTFAVMLGASPAWGRIRVSGDLAWFLPQERHASGAAGGRFGLALLAGQVGYTIDTSWSELVLSGGLQLGYLHGKAVGLDYAASEGALWIAATARIELALAATQGFALVASLDAWRVLGAPEFKLRASDTAVLFQPDPLGALFALGTRFRFW